MDDISRFLKTLHSEGDVFEIRLLNAERDRKCTIAGYFNDADAASQAIVEHDQAWHLPACYVTLNPCEPSLLGRANNRLESGVRATTTDSEITRRRWMLIDLDPKRPKGVSSTDEELGRARAKAEEIKTWLTERGFPAPLEVMSGNGMHLYYRVDLDDDHDDLVRRVLHVLADHFTDDHVDVDRAVHNRSRITKIAGTVARKGDAIDGRPHRHAQLLTPELEPQVVSRERLEAVAGLAAFSPDMARREQDTRYPLPQLEPIRRECAFIGHCYANAASLKEPEWYAALGIVGRCADGDRHAHDMSHAHPEYNTSETDRKLRRATDDAISGPRTCSSIADDLGFEGCAQCRHRGEIKSPIVLGRTRSDAPTPTLDAEVRALAAFPLNDMGNAERFRLLHGSRYFYEPRQNTWYRWNGKLWCPETSTAAIRRDARDVPSRLREIGQAVEADGDFMRFATRSGNRKPLDDMIALAADLCSKSETELNSNDFEINCQNGILDLRTLSLRDHDPAAYMTKIIPVAYVPGQRSVLFDAFMERQVPNQEVRRYIYQVLWYCLTGCRRHHILPVFKGPTQTGKSTIVLAVRALMGDYARPSDKKLILQTGNDHIPEELAQVAQCRMTYVSELRAADRVDATKIKILASTDEVNARERYKRGMFFTPKAKVIWMTNEMPLLPLDDDALKRRISIIPMEQQIPENERDMDFVDRLTTGAELEGIFATIVEEGRPMEGETHLHPPMAVRLATQRVWEGDTIIDHFLADRCVINRENGTMRSRRSDLGRAFEQYILDCQQQQPLRQLTLAGITKKDLYDELRGRDFVERKIGEWHFFGIELRVAAHGATATATGTVSLEQLRQEAARPA
ncbi:MAG: hypothetical protein KDK91_28750 [Gammaproteobacteria bacterium]|nr:hypothetical protein [Gammaproteobacteria bacterium]